MAFGHTVRRRAGQRLTRVSPPRLDIHMQHRLHMRHQIRKPEDHHKACKVCYSTSPDGRPARGAEASSLSLTLERQLARQHFTRRPRNSRRLGNTPRPHTPSVSWYDSTSLDGRNSAALEP